MSPSEILSWQPTADEVRVIVTEMRPIIQAAADRALRTMAPAR